MKKAFIGLMALVLVLGCLQPPAGGNGADAAGNGGDSVDNGTIDPSTIVEVGDTIKAEYRGELESGEVFDSSELHGQPLEFQAGLGRMIRGFDDAVIGMRLNEEKTVLIPPAQGYGFSDPGKVVEIPKENFTNWEELQEGMPVHNNQSGANGIIVEIKEDAAVVDFNHELAGKDLTFWIKVVAIEKAE